MQSEKYMNIKIQHSILLIGSLSFISSAQAQSAQDAGSLLRNTEKSLEQNRLPDIVPSAPVRAQNQVNTNEAQFTLKGFKLEGVNLIPQQDILSVLASWIGKSVTFHSLQQAADAVTEMYRMRGYLVRSYLPEQNLTEGIVTIVVVEGRLGSIRVEHDLESSHLSEQKVRDYIQTRQHIGAPVRPDDLKRATTLLNELPGLSASSVLEPGERDGEANVVVKIRDTPKLTGNVQIDNTGALSTGEYKLTTGVNVNSPLGIGDQLQFVGNGSQNSVYGRLAYSLPLGNDGLRFGTNYSLLPYNYSLSGNTYSGDARVLGLSANYPIYRSNASNLSFSATFDRKNFNNSVQGIEINNKQIEITNIALSGDMLDGFMGGGLTQYTAAYGKGRLDLSKNAADLAADQITNGPNHNGTFSKVTWTLARLQRINPTDTLAVTGSGQFAENNLDSAEKIPVTGPFAVRAYSTSEPGGDNGTILNIELRRQFAEALTGMVFIDSAQIQHDKNDNSATLTPNSGTYSGAGFGVNYGKATGISIHASVAWRIGSNPFRNLTTGQDADGTSRNPRGWVTLQKTF
jgi:hemolysin activation/secretion protein